MFNYDFQHKINENFINFNNQSNFFILQVLNHESACSTQRSAIFLTLRRGYVNLLLSMSAYINDTNFGPKIQWLS